MKLIYIEAFVVWAVYSFGTKYLLFNGVITSKPLFEALFYNFLSGLFFGTAFLYLFSHEDFFPFAKKIEKREIKNEKKWEHRLARFGRVFVVFLISIFVGPMISALSAKFLIAKIRFKYLLVGIFGGLSSSLWLLVARGVVHLPF